MSGHSKWAQIKRQKGTADVKRGQLFTKLGNALTVATRQGGGDPESNIRLRLAIEQARAANMPKQNMQRAIERGLGKLASDRPLEEVTYEGYGPGGIGLVVQGATDNKQRTVAAVKNILERQGGSLATPGSVSWMFKRQVVLSIRPRGLSLEELQLRAIDAGVDDVELAGDVILAYVAPERLEEVRRALETEHAVVESTELTLRPSTTVPVVDKERAARILGLTERLEDEEDVLAVFSNFDIPEDILMQVASGS